MKYSNFSELINSETHAKNYFNSLPDYVRQQIFSNYSSVDSFESLIDCAENLIHQFQ